MPSSFSLSLSTTWDSISRNFVVFSTDEEVRRQPLPLRESVALIRPEHIQGGGERIGVDGIGVEHADGGKAVIDGTRRARIDGVGDAPPSDLVVVAVVAGGREGDVAQGDHRVDAARGAVGLLDAHAPQGAVQATPLGADLAADLDQEVAVTELAESGDDLLANPEVGRLFLGG